MSNSADSIIDPIFNVFSIIKDVIFYVIRLPFRMIASMPDWVQLIIYVFLIMLGMYFVYFYNKNRNKIYEVDA